MSADLVDLKTQFLEHRGSLDLFAKQVNIDLRTLVSMAVANGWMQERSQKIQELLDSAELDYRLLIAERKHPMLSQQLEISSKLVGRIDQILGNPNLQLSVRDLKHISEAWKSATDVINRVIAVSEEPIPETPKPSAAPAVFINLGRGNEPRPMQVTNSEDGKTITITDGEPRPGTPPDP